MQTGSNSQSKIPNECFLGGESPPSGVELDRLEHSDRGLNGSLDLSAPIDAIDKVDSTQELKVIDREVKKPEVVNLDKLLENSDKDSKDGQMPAYFQFVRNLLLGTDLDKMPIERWATLLGITAGHSLLSQVLSDSEWKKYLSIGFYIFLSISAIGLILVFKTWIL